MSSTCYDAPNSRQSNPNSQVLPCGSPNSTNPHFSCCVDGDTCYEDGICGYTHSLTGGSGWYAGGCNDPSFTDPTCFSRCNDIHRPDIVWDASINLWACCGVDENFTPTCSHHTDETFNAPSDKDIKKYYILGQGPVSDLSSSTSTTTTTSSSPSSSPTTANSSPTASPKSTGLSTGAKAGIGVGVAAGALLVALLISAIFLRQRRTQRRRTAGTDQPFMSNQQGYHRAPLEDPRPPSFGPTGHNNNSDPYVKPELPTTEHNNNNTFLATNPDARNAGLVAAWKSSAPPSSEGGYSDGGERRDSVAVEMDASQEGSVRR